MPSIFAFLMHHINSRHTFNSSKILSGFIKWCLPKCNNDTTLYNICKTNLRQCCSQQVFKHLFAALKYYKCDKYFEVALSYHRTCTTATNTKMYITPTFSVQTHAVVSGFLQEIEFKHEIVLSNTVKYTWLI